jgi:hypothetical protein
MSVLAQIGHQEVGGPAAGGEEPLLTRRPKRLRQSVQHHAGVEHGGDAAIGSGQESTLHGARGHLHLDLPIRHGDGALLHFGAPELPGELQHGRNDVAGGLRIGRKPAVRIRLVAGEVAIGDAGIGCRRLRPQDPSGRLESALFRFPTHRLDSPDEEERQVPQRMPREAPSGRPAEAGQTRGLQQEGVIALQP